MSLTLHFHPLSSFCQKVLIGLYELDTSFTPNIVDLGHPDQRAALLQLWPMGKFPVLQDETRARTVPETSVILEYVEQRQDRRGTLIPVDADRALTTRLRDRFYDLHINVPMGKIVTDKLRPQAARDALGVEQAREQLRAAYAVADAWLARGPWAAGDTFTLADCAAAPALFYAHKVLPFDAHAHLQRYFDRVLQRPSFARVVREAQPYLAMFPG